MNFSKIYFLEMFKPVMKKMFKYVYEDNLEEKEIIKKFEKKGSNLNEYEVQILQSLIQYRDYVSNAETKDK